MGKIYIALIAQYPQLQMQSGTTGINAMRVYSVTKQGKDQDPKGCFTRKYVSELANVPEQYIFEPWKIPLKVQDELGFHVGVDYPRPIVHEQESAKIAKERVSEIRKQESTKRQAQGVYQKHGSRSRNRTDGTPGKSAKKQKAEKAQPSIRSHFTVTTAPKKSTDNPKKQQKASPQAIDHAATASLWSCRACTFLNEKPRALACQICGTERPDEQLQHC